jgi:hypothetical protein
VDDLVLHILAGWVATQVTHDIGLKLVLSFVFGEALSAAVAKSDAANAAKKTPQKA